MSRARNLGAAAAHKCKRLERSGIIAGAPNPYKREANRQAWAQGFLCAYYAKGNA